MSEKYLIENYIGFKWITCRNISIICLPYVTTVIKELVISNLMNILTKNNKSVAKVHIFSVKCWEKTIGKSHETAFGNFSKYYTNSWQKVLSWTTTDCIVWNQINKNDLIVFLLQITTIGWEQEKKFRNEWVCETSVTARDSNLFCNPKYLSRILRTVQSFRSTLDYCP